MENIPPSKSARNSKSTLKRQLVGCCFFQFSDDCRNTVIMWVEVVMVVVVIVMMTVKKKKIMMIKIMTLAHPVS